MWKLTLPPKVKDFSWLLICERLQTRQRLHSFFPAVPSNCVFCNQHEESLDHLFMHCSFSQDLWLLTGLPVLPFIGIILSFTGLILSVCFQIMRNFLLKSSCFATKSGELVISRFSRTPSLQLSTLFMLLPSFLTRTTKLILLPHLDHKPFHLQHQVTSSYSSGFKTQL